MIFMPKHTRRTGREAGQIIVLIALLAIALVAFVGLAIDGGRLLLLRRDAQNASDSAMLASTLALCSGGTATQVEAAGVQAASANGFTDAVDDTTVQVLTPAQNAPANTCLDCSVEVVIARDIPSFFIQVVYSGPLSVTTRAVGTCNIDSHPLMTDSDNDGVPDATLPPIGAFWGGAPPGACNQPAVDLAGSDIVIKGNIHSNSDIDMNPSNQAAGGSCDAVPNPMDGGWTFGEITASGDTSGFKDDKSLNCEWGDAPGVPAEEPLCGADCSTSSGGGSPSGDGDKDVEVIPPYLDGSGNILWPVDYDIADFRPGGAVAVELSATGQYFAFTSGKAPSCNGNQANLSYADIPASFKNADGSLKPAVYYSDCNVEMKNDMAQSTATFVAEGTIKVTGTMNVNPFYDDLLFFANGPSPAVGGPSCVSDGIHVSSSNSNFTGIIFAPNGNAQFSAASNISLDGCVVGYVVKNSASNLEMTCDPGSSDARASISATE